MNEKCVRSDRVSFSEWLKYISIKFKSSVHINKLLVAFSKSTAAAIYEKCWAYFLNKSDFYRQAIHPGEFIHTVRLFVCCFFIFWAIMFFGFENEFI